MEAELSALEAREAGLRARQETATNRQRTLFEQVGEEEDSINCNIFVIYLYCL